MLNAKKFFLFFSVLCTTLVFILVEAQERVAPNVSEWEADSLSLQTSSVIDSTHTDSTLVLSTDQVLSADSLHTDTVTTKKKAVLDTRVDYEAKDSIVMYGRNLVNLFGEASVKYGTMELTGELIKINTDSSTVFATFITDSIGEEFGYPVFKDGDQSYESKTMRYNFKTKKGFATGGITQQGEGYVTAGVSKKMSDDIMYMKNGKYTTCDDHDHPHFYLQLTKAKVRTGKNIVTGPAYLVIADVPLPVALPFGFFPFTDSYSSGILMPTYGDEMTRGFYLRDGGYYFAFSDYMDLAVTGEIYTKGSWGLNTRSSYRKRYKYSGSFNAGYLKTVTGDKGIDYNTSTDFKVNWTHSQDPKANPYRTLSASVNFSTSSYDRNQINSVYNSNTYTANTKASSVSYTQRFPDSKWTISANASASQNSRDSSVAVTLPNMTITMSTAFPFRRKQAMGEERWYEKISLSYSGAFQNSITTKEDKLFKSNLIKDWNNRFTHNIPISATFNVLKYLNITPSVNYREQWNTYHINQTYDSQLGRIAPADTVWGFNRVYSYNASLGFNTKLYGFFKPWSIFGDKVEMIRHVFTPSISISAQPDFGSSQFGFWRQMHYIDNSGEERDHWYSPYPGAPGRGKSGSLNFSIQNNVEMKVKSDSDSTGVKKISLIDNLSLSSSYNMAADSMKWADITMSLRLKFSKSYTLSVNAILDPYTYRADGSKQDVMRWQDGKGFARLKSTGQSFSYTLNNDTFTKLWAKITGADKEEEAQDSSSSLNADNEEEAEEMDSETSTEQTAGSMRKKKEAEGEYDSDGYLRSKIPWSLSLSYGLNLAYASRDKFDAFKREYPYLITQNFSFSGNITPTPGWNFNFSSSYDFDAKKIVYMNCSVSRSLHCWSMSASFIPIGPYKSYNFSISVNSSLLQDLKYDQSSNYRDAMRWY